MGGLANSAQTRANANFAFLRAFGVPPPSHDRPTDRDTTSALAAINDFRDEHQFWRLSSENRSELTELLARLADPFATDAMTPPDVSAREEIAIDAFRTVGRRHFMMFAPPPLREEICSRALQVAGAFQDYFPGGSRGNTNRRATVAAIEVLSESEHQRGLTASQASAMPTILISYATLSNRINPKDTADPLNAQAAVFAIKALADITSRSSLRRDLLRPLATLFRALALHARLVQPSDPQDPWNAWAAAYAVGGLARGVTVVDRLADGVLALDYAARRACASPGDPVTAASIEGLRRALEVLVEGHPFDPFGEDPDDDDVDDVLEAEAAEAQKIPADTTDREGYSTPLMLAIAGSEATKPTPPPTARELRRQLPRLRREAERLIVGYASMNAHVVPGEPLHPGNALVAVTALRLLSQDFFLGLTKVDAKIALATMLDYADGRKFVGTLDHGDPMNGLAVANSIRALADGRIRSELSHDARFRAVRILLQFAMGERVAVPVERANPESVWAQIRALSAFENPALLWGLGAEEQESLVRSIMRIVNGGPDAAMVDRQHPLQETARHHAVMALAGLARTATVPVALREEAASLASEASQVRFRTS